MRISIEFHAANREDAARELSMINYMVMEGMGRLMSGDKKLDEQIMPFEKGARVIRVTK